MHALIVATSFTPQSQKLESKLGRHYLIDYIELAQHLETEYVEYDLSFENTFGRRLENALRLDLRQATQVARLVRRNNYDTVISLSERVGIPLTFLLKPDIKQVVVGHHLLSPGKLQLIKLFRVPRRWHKILAISRAEAKQLQEQLLLPPNRIDSLLTPVDTEFFKPWPQPANPHLEHIQSIGLSHRDFPTLIDAMRHLPRITCFLRAGSVWSKTPNNHTVANLPPNVHLKPFVHPGELRQCIAESRFTVIPIRQTTQWSAGCTSVQISQAMGRAVIATRLPGLAEYMREGETGLLADPANAEALAENIHSLWRDKNRSEAMGQQGRAWTKSQFSMEQWVARMADILTSL